MINMSLFVPVRFSALSASLRADSNSARRGFTLIEMVLVLSVLGVLMLIGSAVLLYAGVLAEETGWIVLWFSLALAAVGACEGPFWVTAIELGGRRGGRIPPGRCYPARR